MVKPTPNSPLFTVNPHQNTETLLVNASETLSSLNALASFLKRSKPRADRDLTNTTEQM